MTTEEKAALVARATDDIKFIEGIQQRRGYLFGVEQEHLSLLKIALAALTAESRWVAHDGNCRPAGLGKDDFIYIKTRGRELKLPYPAGMINWKHDGSDFDIVAWCNAYAAPTP